MVKTIITFFVISLIFTLPILAQDTSAYEIQRTKVNALLEQRSAKFGQYDNSLNARTGIFGFQTKRDIRNSNEILREIALTDNDIFKELKILLDYKDLQVEQVKTTMNSNSESIINYRKTIKELQDQNQRLSDELDDSKNNSTIAHLFMFTFLVGCAVLGYILYRKIKIIRSLSTIDHGK